MSQPNFKSQFLSFSLLFLLPLICSCAQEGQASSNSSAKHNSIQIKGSDTMVNLGQAWAENYMQKYPDSLVAVTGGGSGTGISALISGTCDIAESSRKIKDKELAAAKANGIDAVEFSVAMDGLAVVVSTQNPINQLTADEVADIFTGKTRNWKELGGHDLPIVLLSREVNSGTHVYFKEHVLRRGDAKRTEEFDDGALLMPSSQAIADEISQNPNAIGYYGIGYKNPTQKILAIGKDKSGPYVSPTIENVMNGSYYISRPLFMYSHGQLKDLVKDFIGFVLSDEGQKIVQEVDFVPIQTIK